MMKLFSLQGYVKTPFAILFSFIMISSAPQDVSAKEARPDVVNSADRNKKQQSSQTKKSPRSKENTNKAPEKIEEILITATRTEKASVDIPNMVHVLTQNDIIHRRQSRNLPEALREIPGVMVQKTSHGQGSPYIRGFTGYHTLLLIDGIRLNNSVMRSGPNQYWNTVDLMSIERLEVVRGPKSVLYGSDAVGGVVNAFTTVQDSYGDGFSTNSRINYRFSGAEHSHIGRFETGGNYKDKFNFIVGASVKDFGIVRAGGKTGRQDKTGYEELDGDIKFEYFLNPDSRLVFAHHRVDIDDAWRTHKTIYSKTWHGTTQGNEKRRVLDQNRELTYLQYHSEQAYSFFDKIRASLSYQVQEENRHRIKKNNTSEKQGFEVDTIGAWIQLESRNRLGHWTYGAEYYHDSVDSFKKKFSVSGTLDSREIQGPVADDAEYDLFGLFIQNEIMLSGSWDFILGGRYTHASADADKVRDPLSGRKTSFSDSWNSIIGSASLVYHLDKKKHWNIFAGVNQGFRAPNLSDLTRFDTARSNEVETATTGLDPEKFISFETGLKTSYDDWALQTAFYYTTINDMIVRTPTGRKIDGDSEVTKKNAGDGYVLGTELNASYRFYPLFTAFGNFNWTYGKVDTFPTFRGKKRREYIDRLMPMTATVGVRWEHPHKKNWVEFVATIVKKQDKLSTRDKSDTQRIPPGGTPGYKIIALRSGWEIHRNLLLTASVENITGKNYRIHGSGQNEPSTNLVIGMDFKF